MGQGVDKVTTMAMVPLVLGDPEELNPSCAEVQVLICAALVICLLSNTLPRYLAMHFTSYSSLAGFILRRSCLRTLISDV